MIGSGTLWWTALVQKSEKNLTLAHCKTLASSKWCMARAFKNMCLMGLMYFGLSGGPYVPPSSMAQPPSNAGSLQASRPSYQEVKPDRAWNDPPSVISAKKKVAAVSDNIYIWSHLVLGVGGFSLLYGVLLEDLEQIKKNSFLQSILFISYLPMCWKHTTCTLVK